MDNRLAAEIVRGLNTQVARQKACFLCGTVATWKGGKAYAKHTCPHGKPCVSGSKYRGQGFVRPPLGGPFYCAQCVEDHR